MLGKKKIIWVLLFIIILGFALRTYTLGHESIWLDEAFSIYHSQQGVAHILSLKDPSPPLYYILLHFWMGLFGNSEFAVRFLSVLFGTASIYAIYILGKSIFNENVGLISATLLAVSPLHIYFSKEARTYILFFLFTLLSMYFYNELHKEKNNQKQNKKNIIGYLIFTSLMLYSHVYAVFLILAQNIHFFIANKFIFNKKQKDWFLIQFTLLIIYIPWILELFSVIKRGLHTWIPPPSIQQLLYMIFDLFSGKVLSSLGLALTILCLLFILTHRLKNKDLLFFSIWIIIPILIPVIYSLIFSPLFIPKYVYFISFPLLILVANSISKMKKHFTLIIILALIVLSILTLNIQEQTTIKDSWNEVGTYLKENYKEGDKIIIIESYEVATLAYYFDQECFQSYSDYSWQNDDIDPCSRRKGIYPFYNIKDVSYVENDNNVWLILSREQYNKDYEEAQKFFDEKYTQISYKEFPSYLNLIKVAYYQKK